MVQPYTRWPDLRLGGPSLPFSLEGGRNDSLLLSRTRTVSITEYKNTEPKVGTDMISVESTSCRSEGDRIPLEPYTLKKSSLPRKKKKNQSKESRRTLNPVYNVFLLPQ